MAAAAGWSARFGFLMASIGFAVGLGNIWRFPYVTGENGGSAFVLVYLACAFLIGVPILMAEVMLGRSGRATPPTSLMKLSGQAGSSTGWRHVGHLNLLTSFAILVSYSVVAGWVLLYLWKALTTGFDGIDAQRSAAVFDTMLTNVGQLTHWMFMALVVACAIIWAGVQKGIERAVVVLMPLLFLLLVGLALFNVFAGGMTETLSYLFYPDFSKLTGATFLAALGQAFFSIGVAMAGMMMFGAYLPDNVSIARSALIIVVADTGVALLAGLVIFPMVFANQLDPAGGAGLIFQTLPVAFGQMPFGGVVAICFFLLLSVAAVTSVVGLCEPLAAWLMERFHFGRPAASVVLFVLLAIFSLVSVLSYNHWADVSLGSMSLSGWIDFVPNQVLLPLGGLLIAVFAGWVIKPDVAQQALGLSNGAFRLWYNLLRYLVVLAVAVIFVNGLR